MWEGIVTAVQAETYTAIVYDLDSNRVEVGDFKIELVEEKDRGIVVPGAVFSWSAQEGLRFTPEIKLSEDELAARLESLIRPTPA